MIYQITFSNTQYIDTTKTADSAIKKAKKNLKLKLGSKLYQEIITDVRCTTLKEETK